MEQLYGAELETKLKTFSTEQLLQLKLELDDKYYNTGDSPFEDNQYDLLVEVLKNHNLTTGIGALPKKGRVPLPVWMGSADKITPANPDALKRWLTKHNPPYVVSEKLDGVSCLYHKTSTQLFLYTRGDGKVGTDISHLIPYLTLPTYDKLKITVRGELIIPKQTFENTYRNKEVEGTIYKNARNMVTGLLSSKTTKKAWKDLEFIAYEIVNNNSSPLSKQLIQLTSIGFKCVAYCIRPTLETLETLHQTFKTESRYELDGIIVHTNQPYIRNINDNPDYMFAFKMLDTNNIHTTVVERIEWEVSKWGQLKPVVVFQSVCLRDVTMNRATAHNAKYVLDNKLGKGAIIRITRSNEVIPYITEVVSSTQPDLPPSYKWDDNHVNFLATEFQPEMCIKLISNFFSQMGIKYVSEATVAKLYEHGLDNLYKIIEADLSVLNRIFGTKTAERIHKNIHEGLRNVDLSTLVAASGTLGYGINRKRVDTLLNSIPDLFTRKNITVHELLLVDGFSEITATKVVSHLKYARQFLKKVKKWVTYKKSTEKVGTTLSGYKILFSSFRNKELELIIKNLGGKVIDSISKQTTMVVVKDGSSSTGKTEKATKLNIPILTEEQFRNKYL